MKATGRQPPKPLLLPARNSFTGRVVRCLVRQLTSVASSRPVKFVFGHVEPHLKPLKIEPGQNGAIIELLKTLLRRLLRDLICG